MTLSTARQVNAGIKLLLTVGKWRSLKLSWIVGNLAE